MRLLPPAPVARRYLRTATLILTAVLLVATTVGVPRAGAADANKVWRGVLSEDAPGFDPAGPTSASAATILELVFERLFTYDYLARPARVVPQAAEAMPEVADDGRTWTVRLKKGIYFSPDPAFKGVRRELVAQDYVYSIKRFMDPAQRSPYQFLFRGKFVGLDELAEAAAKSGRFDYDAPVAGLVAVDRYTVRFRLRARDYRFGYLLAHSAAGALAREVVEAYGRDVATHPVGTGPYVLTTWVPGTRAVLDANPGYRGFTWDFAAGSDPRDRELVAQMRGKTMPQIGHIELFVIEEDTAYWLALLKGDIYVANMLPRFQASSLVGGKLGPDLASKGLSMYRYTDPSISFAAFNWRDPVIGGQAPEKNALRRAIALAYNGDDLVNVVYAGNAARAQMAVPAGIYGHDPAYRSSVPYDPDLANRLLDRFGYKRGPDGFRRRPDGKPLELVVNGSVGGSSRDLDKIWATSMQRIGLRIRILTMGAAEMMKLSTRCTTMIFYLNWSADYPDGENFTQILYGPNANQSNIGCYQSPRYDAFFREAEQLQDGPERARLFIEMSRQAEADTAWLLGVQQNRIVVLHPWVQGHKAHPFLYTVIPYVDVTPH